MSTYLGQTILYPDFVNTKGIFENADKENKYRFSLFVPFINNDNEENNLIVIMKNPSTASSKVCDRTMSKVCNVAYNNGYSGVVVVNLFPVRATNAPDLQLFYGDTNYNSIMENNIENIKNFLSQNSNVVFAWGCDTIHSRKQFPTNYDYAIKHIVKAVKMFNCNMYFVGYCHCKNRTCNVENFEHCNSEILYPLHGLRWSNNSKLIKYIL